MLATRVAHALRAGRREDAAALVRRARAAPPRDAAVLSALAEIAW